MFKKSLVIASLSLALVSQAFAGTEDWVGKFNLKDSRGSTVTAMHTPTHINVSFIQAKTYTFSKGSSMNGMVAKEDGRISYDQSVEVFAAELSKLGDISSREVVFGPTYSK